MTNKHKKALTLSLVIPAYNEAVHIKACLDAVAAQTVMPDEVILVDNNSTDDTVNIASAYPFVRVIAEKKQGLTSARNRGFNESKSNILGRIDADSIIADNWVERVKSDFDSQNIDGVTGLGETRVLIGVPGWFSTFWSRGYYWVVHAYFDIMTMWGANMAISSDAWQNAKDKVAASDEQAHEDQDLSFVIVGNGGKIIQDNELIIYTTGGAYLYWPKFWNYFMKFFRTKSRHQGLGTIKKDNPQRLGFWRPLPGALLGLVLAIIFIIYSLISWPILETMMLFNKDVLKINR